MLLPAGCWVTGLGTVLGAYSLFRILHDCPLVLSAVLCSSLQISNLIQRGSDQLKVSRFVTGGRLTQTQLYSSLDTWSDTPRSLSGEVHSEFGTLTEPDGLEQGKREKQRKRD